MVTFKQRFIRFLFRHGFDDAIKGVAWVEKYVDTDAMARLVYAFSDSNGKKYYKYAKDEWMPLDRYEAQQLLIKQMEARISRQDLFKAFDVITDCINKGDFLNTAKIIGFMKDKMELSYTPNLMMRVLSGVYIREDQIKTAHIWNDAIEEEKYQQMMKDRQDGGLGDFFQKSGLIDHLESSVSSNIELEQRLREELKLAEQFSEMIEKAHQTTSTGNRR